MFCYTNDISFYLKVRDMPKLNYTHELLISVIIEDS